MAGTGGKPTVGFAVGSVANAPDTQWVEGFDRLAAARTSDMNIEPG